MESKIKKMSMREILNNVGFPVIKNEFRSTYKFDVDINLAMDFEDEISQMKDITEIENIIYEYEEIFDKELYIFHVARLLEQDIENLKRAEILGERNIEQLIFTNDKTGKNKRRFFVNAKNLLKICDVVDIEMKKKSKGEFEIYSSVDFLDGNSLGANNRKILAEEKLYRIEEKIGLKNVLKFFKNSDLIEICKYPNLATILIVNQDKFEKKVKKYIQYMDIDKMLILASAVYFYKYGETLNDFSKEDAISLKIFIENVNDIIENHSRKIDTSKFDFEINFIDIRNKADNIAINKLVSKENEKINEIVNKDNEEFKEVVSSENKEVIINENNDDKDVESKKSNEQDDEERKEINEKKSEYVLNFINAENKKLVDCEDIKKIVFKLEENATQEEIEDGTNIFYLPNKECYIVEPINKSFYGTATYIIEKNIFEINKERIIINGRINIKELEGLKINNPKAITKIVHTGWENSLITFFDMRNDEKYTKEEIENIEKIVKEIKK